MKTGPYFYDQKDHVEQMVDVLAKGKWKFTYIVIAHSPRGFTYRGEGKSPDQAFLQAFGLWKRDLLARVKNDR
jgi:hypothetical protein